MSKIAAIIPCYNEELRLDRSAVNSLLKDDSLTLFFANDGSTDGTLGIIKGIAAAFPGRCKILHYEQNHGKAGTVYRAVRTISDMEPKYDFIGYFDADFSTPPAEILRMIASVNWETDSFLFGSRVKLLNTRIERKWYRHVIGRVIITLINFKFGLGIYDTQCGAKIFSRSIIEAAFSKPFSTSWLFDVEIFIRLKKLGLLGHGREFPLMAWKDVEGSKLGFGSVFKILRELQLLNRNN